MALYNISSLIALLSKMTNIEADILITHQALLIKSLSSLENIREYKVEECAHLVNNISDDFFKNIGITKKEKRQEFKKSIMIILKEHWSSFVF